MGRRSINTTKSGKFMNPTDQARKEARKKELKKNKKQRQMVRAAVLKGKDPNHLIAEMEKIDRMEYDVNNPPLLNEKVLKDKRKKLRETFARVLKLYEKEDPEQWRELRRLEGEYEMKRNFLVQYFESVRHAQQVQVEDIPLPAMQMPSMLTTSQIPLPGDIPLPTLQSMQPHSILKKTSAYELKDLHDASRWHKSKKKPGVPPGPPPPLSDLDDSDSDIEKLRKIRFSDDGTDGGKDARVMAGNDETESEKSGTDEAKSGKAVGDKPPKPPSILPAGLPPGPPPGLPPGPPPGLPPLMFRPMRPGGPPVRLPPGPPPGRPPGHPGPPPGLPPRMLGPPPIRLPPGPPPGMPPMRLMRPPGMPPSGLGVQHPLGFLSSISQSTVNSNVLSAPPSLINRSKMDDEHKGMTTIEAKPQIRNLSVDITRFMPTSLRVKREEKGKKQSQRVTPLGMKMDDLILPMTKMAQVVPPTKDDAYEQFMKEMEDLL